ncbi:MAG TPA: glycosyltransferase, partial [Labilithrix sp.]|nr:glycosyltransferase [Labilithrix sp.]
MTFRYVFIGLSLRSSWGNGHATTYQSLLRALVKRGHEVTFLERDHAPFAEHCEFDPAPWAELGVYRSLAELLERFAPIVRTADLVVVGSRVPDGIAVGKWALDVASGRVAFYDIDTPVTLAALIAG